MKERSLLLYVLEPPEYGWTQDGKLYVPTTREIFSQLFKRVNLFADRRNWLSAFGWFMTFLLIIPFFVFVLNYFTWPLAILGMTYSMVVLGSHGTLYLHRYSTHRAYAFKNKLWLFLVKNLTIKIIPEETYVVSHHVHHKLAEQPGDPYNVHAGWLYCFTAETNHQMIARNLSEKDYKVVCNLLAHTGIKLNTFEQYKKWGTVSSPLSTVLSFLGNWIFWYATLFLIGGHALATAIFGCAVIWGFGIRTFNYDGHGRGKDRRSSDSDFNSKDWSVNQLWPGFVAGEWHNNHHLYPSGAKAGFLFYQLDLPWMAIRFFHWLGGIEKYKDYTSNFYQQYYVPYLEKKAGYSQKLKGHEVRVLQNYLYE